MLQTSPIPIEPDLRPPSYSFKQMILRPIKGLEAFKNTFTHAHRGLPIGCASSVRANEAKLRVHVNSVSRKTNCNVVLPFTTLNSWRAVLSGSSPSKTDCSRINPTLTMPPGWYHPPKSIDCTASPDHLPHWEVSRPPKPPCFPGGLRPPDPPTELRGT